MHLLTTFDKWMYLLKHMHEMVEIPQIFNTPEFRRLFILSEIGNFTAEEIKDYNKSLENMSDYYNIIDSAEKRAREEGLTQGREEGQREKAIEIARKLVLGGMSKAEAAAVVGVSEEEMECAFKGTIFTP